jgi:uncharacterized protein YndB with AHSA1/START domain
MNAQTMIRVAPVNKSIRVNAAQARAFEVFTARFDAWWPKSHHIGKAEMKEAVIEPRQGGRWYEKGEDGSECVWGKVLAWEPPHRLVLSWHINSKFQIDESVASEVEVRFIAESADVTRVELEHRIEAQDGEAMRTSVDSPGGWSSLLESYREAVSS